MNQSDFAKLHGVSRKTVTSWKARGWLVLAGDDIDVEASNANIERFRKTVTRPEKKAVGNKQGNKTGNRSSGNKSGNKNDKDLPESATKTVERMIAEHGVTMTLDEARQMK
ncbi:RNA polymerase subunit sigma-70, partial [Yersinia enterocolitica]|nr:RNA polymerase subunit sigma-70 [Yersinia enterocolitica]